MNATVVSLDADPVGGAAVSFTATGVEAIAELLGDPLPANWRDPVAIEARRDHLSVVASMAGEVALDELAALVEMRQQGLTLTANTAAVDALAGEIVALDRAMRRYTHETQRSDALGVVQEALEHAAPVLAWQRW